MVRRGVLILGALYGLPLTAWLVGTVIRVAYYGRSLPLLNLVFQRRVPHPGDRYVALWRSSWEAPLLAVLLHLVVVLVILATNRGMMGKRSPEAEQTTRVIDRWLIGFSLVFLMLTALSGDREIYTVLTHIWDRTWARRDPWWIIAGTDRPLNAYGPILLVLALPARCNPLLPKLFFSLAYCLFAVIFLKRGLDRPGHQGAVFPARGLLALLFSPYAWVEIAYYGHFDVLVAIACVAAVATLLQGREVLAGMCLALGFLLKLYPVVIVPFFALDRAGHRVRGRFLAGALVPMALGYAVSFLIWGSAALRPFRFAYERESAGLSIFRFLSGWTSPLRWFMADPNLDAWSTPCMAFAVLVVLLACWRRGTDPATSAVLAVLTTLFFHRVGFVQYQMSLFLLLVFWLGRYAPALAQDRGLAVAIGGYFAWLTFFDLFYLLRAVLRGHSMSVVLDPMGLPSFLLGCFLMVNLLRVGGRLEEPSVPGRDWETHPT